MPYINNPESIVTLVTHGVKAFVANEKYRRWQVVVWLEPEHEHCGLYISSATGDRSLVPSDFDFPNYDVTDVMIDSEAIEDENELLLELENIVRGASAAIEIEEAPQLWRVQVDFAFYKTSEN